MTSRQRGAAWLLGLLLLGRLLDAVDLPFERRAETEEERRIDVAPSESAVHDGTRKGIAAPPGGGAAASPGAAPGATVEAPGLAPADSLSRHRGGAGSRHDVPRPVHLNRATAADLQTLPGIGPVLAQRILEYRAARGPLRTLADLQQVRGIGARTCARLAPWVRFD